MAIATLVALFNRTRSGTVDWPDGMRSNPNAPASTKMRYPALFLPMHASLNLACSDFDELQRKNGSIQWCYNRAKKIASTSSVLKTIHAGVSNYHLRAGYVDALRVKIERANEVAQPKIAPPPSKKRTKPLSASAPSRQSGSAPVKPKAKTARKAAPTTTARTTAMRVYAQIGDGSVQVPAKRLRVQKQFPDFE